MHSGIHTEFKVLKSNRGTPISLQDNTAGLKKSYMHSLLLSLEWQVPKQLDPIRLGTPQVAGEDIMQHSVSSLKFEFPKHAIEPF